MGRVDGAKGFVPSPKPAPPMIVVSPAENPVPGSSEPHPPVPVAPSPPTVVVDCSGDVSLVVKLLVVRVAEAEVGRPVAIFRCVASEVDVEACGLEVVGLAQGSLVNESCRNARGLVGVGGLGIAEGVSRCDVELSAPVFSLSM